MAVTGAPNSEGASSEALESFEVEVLGRVGEVISPQVDAVGGRVQVEDGGASLIFHAKTSSGAVYPRGAKVVLLSVDEHHVYEVISQSEFDRK